MGLSIERWELSPSDVMKTRSISNPKREIQRENKQSSTTFFGERVLRYPIIIRRKLEDDAHHEADTPARNRRIVDVGEAAHIVHMD